jgi:hypothetical protein
MNLAISVCLTETTEVEKEWDTKWAWVSSAALFNTVPIGLVMSDKWGVDKYTFSPQVLWSDFREYPIPGNSQWPR